MRTGYATRNEKQQQQKNQSEVSEAAARLQLIFKGREVQSGVCSGVCRKQGGRAAQGCSYVRPHRPKSVHFPSNVAEGLWSVRTTEVASLDLVLNRMTLS